MQPSKTSPWKPGQSAVRNYLFLCAAGLIVASTAIAVEGNLSVTRVFLLAAAVLLSLVFFYASWKLRNNDFITTTWWISKVNNKLLLTFTFVTFLFFLIGWVIVWTPLSRFGLFYYYVQGTYPLLVWLTLASGLAFFLLFSYQKGFRLQQLITYIKYQKIAFITAGVLFLISIPLAWFALSRVVGITPVDEDFWYGAGVPVLAFQVIFSLVIGFGLQPLIQLVTLNFPISQKFVNAFLFLLIWAFSAYLWGTEPVKPDFLITQPVAPNFEMYPDYDARNYDIMSQFALIGQGINNHSFFDRVLYPTFLTYLHAFVGQNYSQLMTVQAAVFAVQPALLFIIGLLIYNRSAGLSLGILTLLRGINHIRIGNVIETAHQKQMLTEYPTAILLVIVTLMLIRWAKNPQKDWPLAGLAGCIVGFATLLRPHALVLIPVFFLLAFWVYRHRIKIGVGLASLFLLAAFFGVFPWVQFGGQKVSLFSLYYTRIEDVIRQRYPQLINPPNIDNTDISTNEQKQPEPNLSIPEAKPEKSVFAFALDNFLNNLVTSVQALPNTPFNLEPREIIKNTDNFWKPYWDGSVSFWASILIPVNLLILALGIGFSWNRARLSGLIPLVILIAYYLINALGRTSGGRYLVPVDWVVIIYYILGLAALLDAAGSFFVEKFEKIPPLVMNTSAVTSLAKNTAWVLISSLALGAILPLSQNIIPQHFPPTNISEDINLFTSIAGEETGLNQEDLNRFLSSENAILIRGRSLYPRQLSKDEGLSNSVYNFYHPLPYPRTLFTTIGQSGEKVIILPRTIPAEIPNAIDVMVLGCLENGFVQARTVIRMDNREIFNSLTAGKELSCPLPQPICKNNKVCN